MHVSPLAKFRKGSLPTREIPAIDELAQYEQFVCWRAILREGKIAKLPFTPQNLPASVTDPHTWSSFDACLAAVVANENFSGIGFVFTASDPYIGVDLDKCRNPETGAIEEWALSIIRKLNSYTEASPSGTGVHIILKETLPPGGRRRGRVEMYDRGRYFTLTGIRL